MADIAAIRKRALACLTPPPRLALSAWIENEIWLAEGLTAVPGPMRLYPQQRGIADAIGDSGIPRVTVLKASRVGYTALLVSAIGNYCINDPSPVLALPPVESDCKDFVKSELEPLFAAVQRCKASLRTFASGSGASGETQFCRGSFPAEA